MHRFTSVHLATVIWLRRLVMSVIYQWIDNKYKIECFNSLFSRRCYEYGNVRDGRIVRDSGVEFHIHI